MGVEVLTEDFTDEQQEYILLNVGRAPIKQLKLLCNYHLTIRQMEQICLGFDAGIDVSKYSSENNSPEQMEEIRLALEKGYDISPYMNETPEKRKQIFLGMQARVDISVYAKSCYNAEQMKEIRLGQEAEINVSVYADPKYTSEQMKEIRLALEIGMVFHPYPSWSVEEIRKRRCQYEDKFNVCTTEQKKIIISAARKKEPISMIDYTQYSPEQMEEILLAWEEGIDILKLTKRDARVERMREERKKIERQRREFKALLSQIS